MEKPTTSHLIASKRIMRFVKGTCNYGIQYIRNQNNQAYEIFGYSDSDWNGDKDGRKNIAAYVFMYVNVAVVALSSCEAEYIAASMSACQEQQINMLMMEMKLKEDEKMELMIDITSLLLIWLSIQWLMEEINTLRHVSISYHKRSSKQRLAGD